MSKPVSRPPAAPRLSHREPLSLTFRNPTTLPSATASQHPTPACHGRQSSPPANRTPAPPQLSLGEPLSVTFRNRAARVSKPVSQHPAPTAPTNDRRTSGHRIAFPLACLFLFFLTLAPAAAPIESELLFPQEKWHNHSSSIVELPNGDLLVCWFHGSGERTADDVLIQAARWNHETRKWGDRFTLADTPGFPDTNPMLFLDSKQRLFLFWPAIIANEWYTALMKYRISSDYQQPTGPPKWEFQDNVLLKPKDMAVKTKSVLEKDLKNPGPFAQRAARLMALADDKYFSRMGWFTRTHALELPTGRILLPLYSDGYSFSLIGISDDGGITWTASEPIVGYGCIQPSLVRKKDGTLVAYMRDNGPPPKRAHISYSKDDGVSWTGAVDTEIPNPGTSLEAIALKNGNWVMVYNDLESQRYSLAISLSEDEGKTWKYQRHLDGDPANKSPNQYHYPSVMQSKDGAIHVTYSYFTPEGKSIKHVRLDESWIRQPVPRAQSLNPATPRYSWAPSSHDR